MNRIEELNQIIAQFDLNQHPFYADWRMGTLPTEKLRDYAGEYGRFVGTIAQGWDTLGETHYAEEERVHEKLWEGFQSEVNFTSLTNRPQTEVLVTAASKNFESKPEAVGALFAFEAQQPNTAQTKLDGLIEHYPQFTDTGKEYFRVHANDFKEVEDLKKIVATMSDQDFARAKTACAVVCASMWGALDGIYYN